MSLPINIDDLLHGHTIEWERIECKQGWNPESILHTMTAFANDLNNWGGGYILVGLQEENGRPVLPPVGLPLSSIDRMQKELLYLSRKIQPYYIPIPQPYVFDGKPILVIWSPGGDNRPYKAPESLEKKSAYRYFVRRGSNSVIANYQEERLLFDLAKRIPFDDRVNHYADLDVLNFGVIRSFLHEIRSELAEEAPRMKLEDLALQMHIASGPSESIKPLNVALLFFSEQPHRFFSSAQTDVVIYHDNIGISFTEKIFTGPLHDQLKGCLSFIKTNIIKEQVTKVDTKAEAIRIHNFPLAAVEEVIANAFYHKSYEMDSPIEINCYADRLEVLSFPGPLPPVTRASLKEKKIVNRVYRNRRIGDFLKELKLTEGRATGFPTIYRSMELNGSPPPTFETDDDLAYFLATLPVHPDFVVNAETVHDEGLIYLDEKKLEILRFCITPKKRSEILSVVNLSSQTKNFRRHISPLIEAGWLALTDKLSPQSPQQKYFTTTNGLKMLARAGH